MIDKQIYEMNVADSEQLLISTFKDRYDELSREINKFAFEKNMDPEGIAAFFITAAVVGIIPYRDPDVNALKFATAFAQDFFNRILHFALETVAHDHN